MSSRTLIRALVCVLCLACQGLAAAQPGGPTGPANSLDDLRNSLQIIEEGLDREHLTRSQIDRIREQLEYVADDARGVRDAARRATAEQKKLLEALGPKPEDTEPAESAEITAERRQLEQSIARHQGRLQSANVLLARVDGVRSSLATREIGVLTRVLTRRGETPLSPGLISRAAVDTPTRLAAFTDTVGKWWQQIDFDRERFGTLIWWLVVLVFVVASVPPARSWVMRRYGPDRRDESPSFTRRFRVMLAVGLGNVVMPVISVLGVYIVLLKGASLTEAVHDMIWLLTLSLCQFFVITGLSSAAISPDYPVWRINHFSNDSAVGLHRDIRLYAVVAVLLNVVWIPISGELQTHQFAEALVMDVADGPLRNFFGAVAVVVISAAMLLVLRGRNWWFVLRDESGETRMTPPNKATRVFFTIAKAGLVLSIAAALVGYVNLGIFLSQRVIWSLLLIAFAYLLRAFVAATCSQAVGAESDIGSLLRNTLGYSNTGAERLLFWVMLFVDVVLVAAAAVFLLLIWGVDLTYIQSHAVRLIYGIDIGSYTLSLMDVGVAAGIFVLLLVVVRLFQGFLSNRVLTQTVPDVGVRDALTTGVGYVGIVIAGFVAISSLGLELSQLAIIFGALSVGIGFGLQHVVSNFVSGLILLMQRPIKAGDWIVVGAHEGYVRKINVVSTEIQTFDNAEVIVPNGQLVSSEVLNWTHKSTVARVIVGVRVAYDSDPVAVRDLLLRLAGERDDILTMPAPFVVFREFGDSGLEFEVRFFIREADYMLATGSDLRFDIVAAFREAGIVIPYPQRDIHVRNAGGEAEPDSGSAAVEPSTGRRGRSAAGSTSDGG